MYESITLTFVSYLCRPKCAIFKMLQTPSKGSISQDLKTPSRIARVTGSVMHLLHIDTPTILRSLHSGADCLTGVNCAHSRTTETGFSLHVERGRRAEAASVSSYSSGFLVPLFAAPSNYQNAGHHTGVRKCRAYLQE